MTGIRHQGAKAGAEKPMTTVACWETEAAPRAGMIWHKNGDLGPPSLGPVRAGCGQSGCPSHSLGLPPPNSRRLMVATMVCSPLCLWRGRESYILLCLGGAGGKPCGLLLMGVAKEGPFPGPALGRSGRGLFCASKLYPRYSWVEGTALLRGIRPALLPEFLNQEFS